MDQVLIRTCSAGEAAVLAREAGRCARVGDAWVRIHRPAGDNRIDPSGFHRYVARVEVVDSGDEAPSPAGTAAAEVISHLFGPYLA
jgi:hypothetical protein